MKKNNTKKCFLFVILFLAIFSLTFHTIFSNNRIEDIVNNLTGININYGIIIILLLGIYFLLQGIYMKRNLQLLDEKIPLRKGVFYAIIEFFFSGVTPSSTGGQPVQLYYMSRDGIKKKSALITLLINTIYFKFIIALLGTGLLIFKYDILLNISPLFLAFYIIGIVVDLFIVVGGYLLLFKQSVIKKIMELIQALVRKVYKNYDMNIDETIEAYNIKVNELKKNKLELAFEFVLTLVQRICMFAIAYVVYRAFGLNQYDFFHIVGIQIAVQTAIECVPLPGGTGLSEYALGVFYEMSFGLSLASTAMLVNRTFTFYAPLIVCGIIILIIYIKDLIKKRG